MLILIPVNGLTVDVLFKEDYRRTNLSHIGYVHHVFVSKYMVFISVSEIDFTIHSPLNLRGNEQWQNHKDEHY